YPPVAQKFKVTCMMADDVKPSATNELVLRMGNFVCPPQLVNDFTPLEFEEVVHLFEKYDDDQSGTLDVTEVRHMLQELQVDYDEAHALQLLKKVDTDGSGRLDFAEFCVFLARVKAGDKKLRGLGALTALLNETPAAVLQQQAAARGLTVEYRIVEERPATAQHPFKHLVMEVVLTGQWYGGSGGGSEDMEDGGGAITTGARRFQGVGKSTREARLKAAQVALVRLAAAMPGLR
ncbi:unnamed protein product, partial [Phaeothamnion confervicola]